MCGTSRWHLQAAADENYGLSGSWVEAYGFRFPGVGFFGFTASVVEVRGGSVSWFQHVGFSFFEV